MKEGIKFVLERPPLPEELTLEEKENFDDIHKLWMEFLGSLEIIIKSYPGVTMEEAIRSKDLYDEALEIALQPDGDEDEGESGIGIFYV